MLIIGMQMLEYHTAHQRAQAATQKTDRTTLPTSNVRLNASRALNRGRNKVDNIMASLLARRTSSLSSVDSSDTPEHSARSSTPSITEPRELTEDEIAEAERLELEKDGRIVDEEMASYKAAGLISGDELEDLNLERHWQVCIQFCFCCANH